LENKKYVNEWKNANGETRVAAEERNLLEHQVNGTKAGDTRLNKNTDDNGS